MTEHQFEQAIGRMVRGDKTGLKEIYENYLGYIYRIIYEILRSKENAEDVTSDFFIRLWDKAGQFKPGTGHKGYLAAMARNMAIDFLRKHKREELTDMLQDLEKIAEPYEVPGRKDVPEMGALQRAVRTWRRKWCRACRCRRQWKP